ncbi:hypothetical protein NDU88_002751 [Pleurodeles waltl]|uniref:Uncharacterized protein n=1 Tax=Pleurodeles waltl TaxID=8319 RepID=A0AAV7Q7W3_PLEWA|nr:hypothetical protein NDU88_002751 [Pleurodeles waltl]
MRSNVARARGAESLKTPPNRCRWRRLPDYRSDSVLEYSRALHLMLGGRGVGADGPLNTLGCYDRCYHTGYCGISLKTELGPDAPKVIRGRLEVLRSASRLCDGDDRDSADTSQEDGSDSDSVERVALFPSITPQLARDLNGTFMLDLIA